jgi:secreted trypsin-like serine protease
MHTKNLARAVIAAIAVLVMAFSPVAAVTDGEYATAADYPYVGVMVAFVGKDPAWRCSGALVSPTVFVTAGHCTDGADSVQVWFAHNVEDDREGFRYPFKGDSAGTAYTHPSYDPNAFYLLDLGVVVLKKPIYLDRYAALPYENQVDENAQGDIFTAVGYGLQKSYPDAAAWKNEAALYRMYSYPTVIQINGGTVGTESLLLSNNANTGGTCFGDSGGPNFIGYDGDVIGGVTSFGMNGTCAGTGGVYRIDRADDIYWILGFL